jgi:NIPSNAP
MPTPTATSAVRDTSAVLELRQYTLHPGRRDTLIDLFEERFIESQEALGMRVLGQFRDADDPDRFVWLRGFRDMATRKEGLRAFYTGPVWQAHRAAANATMIDSDDVLLLRPAASASGLVLPGARPALGAAPPTSRVVATILSLAKPVDDDFLRFFDARVSPILGETGGAPIARLCTEYAENDFPALPVRAGVHAFVWLATFATAAEHERHLVQRDASVAWRTDVVPALAALSTTPPRELRLVPTARSLLRHPEPSPSPLPVGDAHDFDFLAGTWRVKNRRLRARGVGATEWEEFSGESRVALHLGGVANVDEIAFPALGFSGLTVRTFDLATRRWSIHWTSSKTGKMDPPVHGGFRGDRGEFYGDDEDGGRPVKVRFVWTKLGASAARWEQAFSYDGALWETNWIMELRRDAP